MRFCKQLKWYVRCAKLAKLPERIFFSTPPGHYYSAIPSASDFPHHAGNTTCSLSGIELHVADQLALAKTIGPLIENSVLVKEKTDGNRFYLDNTYFPYPDALLLQAMIRHFRPARIVEVGSGFSSAVMLDTRDTYQLDMQLTYIDPQSKRLNSLLRDADHTTATIVGQDVRSVDRNLFDALEPNSFLFIDSSHVSKFASDVNYLFFEILPRLRPGVLVHVHDIFWPFEYPLEWLESGWAWSEAYLLRACLMNNQRLRVLLFPSYLESCHTEFLRGHWPSTFQRARTNPSVGGASIWLRVEEA